MSFRYTDVNTRAVYSVQKGGIGQAGKIAKFWVDSAGTVPVDLGSYSALTPDTAGASLGTNQLTVQADGTWPEMWDRTAAQDYVFVQVGTVASPGVLYRIFCDADQRLDTLTTAPVGLGITLPGAVRAPVALMGTALQTSHGYATNAGGSSNLNDTTQYVLGTQSASLTTDGAATAKTLKRTAMTAVSATGRQPVFWVKMDDQTHLAACQLYLGDTNLANSYKWDIKSSATQKWAPDGLWHRVVLSWSEAVIAGSPTRSAITDAQFRIVDDALAPITVHFNGWGLVAESTTWPNGVVSLTFDDTYLSHYTTVRPKLDQYGFSATAYVIQEYAGQAGRMTMQNLVDLQRFNGWEIAGHATTGAVHAARFTSMDAAALATEFSTIRSWLNTNGFSGDHVAYPGGEFNDTVLDAAEKYFTAGVTVFPRPETLPPARRSKMRRGGYVTSATSTASLTAAIDAAYTNKEWLIFGFHDVVTTTVGSTDYSIANFGTVVDYLATKGIPVRTVGDVLRVRP